MKPYSFLRNDWDGSPKTVWSRKKQDKLFNILITKYPTAKELRKKLLDIGTEESYNLGSQRFGQWIRLPGVFFLFLVLTSGES